MNPSTREPAEHLYCRFLTLAQTLTKLHGFTALKPMEVHLLQEVVMRDFENRAFTVSEAVAMKHLGSPATLHKRLIRLRGAGFLSVQKNSMDHRTKFLIATPLAVQHFEHMGEIMQMALKA